MCHVGTDRGCRTIRNSTVVALKVSLPTALPVRKSSGIGFRRPSVIASSQFEAKPSLLLESSSRSASPYSAGHSISRNLRNLTGPARRRPRTSARQRLLVQMPGRLSRLIAPVVRNARGLRCRACGCEQQARRRLQKRVGYLCANRFSARGRPLSVSCARGSDAPVERAEGDVRSVGTECD